MKWKKGRAHEWICECGVGHYDNGWPHGCCGCCGREDFPGFNKDLEANKLQPLDETVFFKEAKEKRKRKE